MKTPPMDPWSPGVSASAVPVVDRGEPAFDFAELPEPECNIDDFDMPEPGESAPANFDADFVEQDGDETPLLSPNKADISRHLYALFPPDFVKPYPDAWIEIAFAAAAGLEAQRRRALLARSICRRRLTSRRRRTGPGLIYVGPSLRQGTTGPSGRSKDDQLPPSIYSWADLEGAGDFDRVSDSCRPTPCKMPCWFHRDGAAQAGSPIFQAHRQRHCGGTDEGRQRRAENVARHRRR